MEELGGLKEGAKPKKIQDRWSGEAKPSIDDLKNHLLAKRTQARKAGLYEPNKRAVWDQATIDAFFAAVEEHAKKSPDDERAAIFKATAVPIAELMGALAPKNRREVTAKIQTEQRRATALTDAPAPKKAKKAPAPKAAAATTKPKKAAQEAKKQPKKVQPTIQKKAKAAKA